MRYKFSTLFLFLLGLSFPAFAQFYPTQYRPGGQDWQYLSTTHFKVVYAAGNDSSAMQMGRILETHYGPVQKLVGGHLSQFPVILNSYNDLSNGFVTPFHFRSEIELPPIKGKSLNPQTGNWLKNVAPHELTHAMQFSHLGDYSIPRLVSIFSPDLARSFHAAIPSGILEGIAVEHETNGVAPHGGRGNYPLFTNQFNAVFKSDRRWSMGQLTQISSYTRPFDRHYIGGYEFTAWLQETYGPSTTIDALDFYMDFPFLGYGVALRHVTGHWPVRLYDEFEADKKEELTDKGRIDRGDKLVIPFKGREIRRPKWLSDSTLVFYGSFHNARPGFYTYQLWDHNLKRVLTTNTVGDYRYDISRNQSKLIYSYYDTDPIYDNTYKSELVQYDLASGTHTQLTKNGRLYAPVFEEDEIWALQTRPASSGLVKIDPPKGQKISQIIAPADAQIIAVEPNPVTNQWAIVANKNGKQALWFMDANHPEQVLNNAPDISFLDGSIFDPEWHPDGSKLLFSSDISGTQQVYEYDLKASSITQITHTAFNAFEASYSPDGNRIVFIKQEKNERLPVILNRSDFFNASVSGKADPTPALEKNPVEKVTFPDSIMAQSRQWHASDYAPGISWLRPRTVLPIFEEVSNQDVYQAGFSIHSTSLLADQSYSAEFTYLEERGWYDISYQNKSFYPGFKVRLYSRPSYRFFEEGSTIETLLRQHRSLALSVPIRVRLNQNIYNTGFFIEPEIRQSQTRYFEIGSGNNKSDFSNNTIANIYGQFNFRLQQNIRDLQPNTGLFIFSELEHYLNSDGIDFSAYGNNLSLSSGRATALNGGVFAFVSPLRGWNQSLRFGLRGLTQSDFIFDNQSLVSDAFSEPIFLNSNNLLSFSTRYTIPLTYVDDGGLLLPFYLSSIYLVAFSDTVTDPTFDDWYNGSRSVFGLGIQAQFRLSNLGFNIGVGYGFEPTRQASNFFIGDF